MTPVESFREILELMANDPQQAACRLEALAHQLQQIAAVLRQGDGGIRDKGVIRDRVQIQVVRPDGSIRQTADTGCPSS